MRCNSVEPFRKFAEHYDLTYQKIRNYEKDCNALEAIFTRFSKQKPKNILDIGCGTGTHALILSRRGCNVVGIDVSEAMIAKAQAKVERAKTRAEFHVQDMRRIELGKMFDSAICMFGAFGLVQSHKGLVDIFSGLRRHLIKNGLFVFDFWSVLAVKPTPFQRWIEARDRVKTVYRLSESIFDHRTDVMIINMKFVITHKNRHVDTFEETLKIKCYTLAEMQQHLLDDGFKLVSVFNWDSEEEKDKLKPPAKETFRILAVAKRS